jgi:hypothetical protein
MRRRALLKRQGWFLQRTSGKTSAKGIGVLGALTAIAISAAVSGKRKFGRGFNPSSELPLDEESR